MTQDKVGNVWFGSQRAGGIYRFDGHSFTNLNGADGLGDNWVRGIIPDRDGSIWIGTRKNGVSHYNGRSFIMFTDNDKVCESGAPLLQDKVGNIWFGGCGWGVRRYDGKTFTKITTKDGLGHNRVCSLVEDQAGNIWFGGKAGSLTRFDGKVFEDFSGKIH